MHECNVRTFDNNTFDIKNNNTITLNSDLIHYPIDFVEYVVLHEFAHFVYMNHSKEFYDLIKKHMPDYQKRIEHMKSLDAEHI